MNGALHAAASQQGQSEVSARLCQAEVQAVLDKFGMAMGVKRTEEFVNGEFRVNYSLLYLPKPRGNGSGKPV